MVGTKIKKKKTLAKKRLRKFDVALRSVFIYEECAERERE